MNIKNIKNYIIFALIIIVFSLGLYVYKIKSDIEINSNEKISSIDRIERNYFWDDFELKDYEEVDFKITQKWKKIIKNIREHKSIPTLISSNSRDKELCAWYIWSLSEIIWWEISPYYIWMMNKTTLKPAKAWELANYYKFLWWSELIDFTWRFSIKDKDLYEKINRKDIKNFFLKAFSEEALLWDIWFLYKNSSYISFLDWWNSNSHITKNIWISKFQINFEEWKNNIAQILWCNVDVYQKIEFVLDNYKIWLNDKRIVYKHKEFYYLNEKNELKEKVEIKFWDKLVYQDIVIAHFFDKKARVESLFNFICKWDFLPVNIISINPRIIEKM